jgi:3'-phosphoadenosine 5'-phosphosulfate sulfotransferase (PAPS reductase)/FAD synthetase
MASHGEILPKPIAAVFADTQAEPRSVYEWLDWLETKLDFPVYRVTAGSLRARSLDMRHTADGRKFSKTDIPFFTLGPDGSRGKIQFRTCTKDFKIRPLLQKYRKLASIKRGEKELRVTSWIGISMDEISRMKPSRDPWVQNRWPLIEKNVSRADCKVWMRKQGYPEPPRSACYFCPFHNDHEWRRLRDEEPLEWERAVVFEKELQAVKGWSENFYSTPYLHASRVPLEKVDLQTLEDHGQLNLFENECEGMCGV